LDVIEFSELSVIVIWQIGHELLLCLLAEIFRIYEEQDTLGIGVLEQPVDRSNGCIGLARAGRHLHQGSRAVFSE
jgi:hypothetical protein